jgi:hypothetical protein
MSTISWRDRLAAIEHELHVVILVTVDALDRRSSVEPDWQRLTLALHRIRALKEMPS